MPPITVRLFAAYREAAGSPSVEIDLPAGATVADLRRALLGRVPAIAATGAALVVALDGEFCPDNAPVPKGAEVAVFPPVAGG